MTAFDTSLAFHVLMKENISQADVGIFLRLVQECNDVFHTFLFTIFYYNS